jgi:HEAT repeat protein
MDRAIFLFVSLTSLFAVTTTTPARAGEPPVYNGKTFTQWMEALQDIWHPERQQEARKVLGPHGPYASIAIAALIEALKDRKSLDYPVEETVIDYGPDVIPVLVEALKRRDPGVRAHIATALGRFGPKAKEAVSALILALRDSDCCVRRAAASALGEIGPEAKPAADALFVALADDTSMVSGRALHSLRKIGVYPKHEVLVAALNDRKQSVREAAADLLLDARFDGPAAVPEMIKVLKSDSGYARVRAAQALGNLAQAAPLAIPVLIEAAQDKDTTVRESAISSLAEIAPKKSSLAIVLLAPGIETPPRSMGLRARTQSEYEPSIRALTAVAADRDEWTHVREAAVRAVTKISDPGAPVNAWPVRNATGAATTGSPASQPITSYLQHYWNDLASDDESKAYQAQWKLILVDEPAVSFLRRLLRPAPRVPEQIISSLVAKLDAKEFQDRGKARLELQSVVEQAEEELRQVAATSSSPEVRRHAEALLDLLDRQKSRSLRAVAVLEQIGSANAKAGLRDLANGTPGDTVTREARAALMRLVIRKVTRDQTHHELTPLPLPPSG